VLEVSTPTASEAVGVLNLALPKTNWISVATNIAGGSGNFSLTATNVVSPALPQKFFILSTTNNLP
jgi:hypothetical protein